MRRVQYQNSGKNVGKGVRLDKGRELSEPFRLRDFRCPPLQESATAAAAAALVVSLLHELDLGQHAHGGKRLAVDMCVRVLGRDEVHHQRAFVVVVINDAAVAAAAVWATCAVVAAVPVVEGVEVPDLLPRALPFRHTCNAVAAIERFELLRKSTSASPQQQMVFAKVLQGRN